MAGAIEIFLKMRIALGGQSTTKVEQLSNNKWENKTEIGTVRKEIKNYHGFSTMVLKGNSTEFLFVFGKKAFIIIKYIN